MDEGAKKFNVARVAGICQDLEQYRGDNILASTVDASQTSTSTHLHGIENISP